MEVLIVNLPRKVPEETAEPSLNGMLKTLLSPELCWEMGVSREETKLKMQKKFELQEKNAEEYVKQYYNG